MDGFVEEIVVEQILQTRIVAESLGDVLQEDRSDNTATAPHQRDLRLVELPLVRLASFLDQLNHCQHVTFYDALRTYHESLRIGDDLRGVESLL